MTEQMTTEPPQTVPPTKAPIDTQARKPRTAMLPPATRYPVGAVPELFVPMADKVLSAGPRGEAMFRDIVSSLEAAQNVMNTCADGEDKIIKSENELRQSAHADIGRTAMVGGKVTTIPGRYDELARAMGPALDRAISDIDARLKRHNDHMLGLIKEMDAALVCTTTGNDKNLMAQVRDHMMTLTQPQRKAFLSKAATDGDLVAIHTVMNSPAYLMGIDEKDKASLRETARKFIKPDHQTAYEVGEKAEKAMELAKKSLVEKKARVERYRLEDQRQATDAVNKIKRLPT